MSITLENPKISLKTSGFPYTVARCQELGRYLVAAKDLQKGEIILQELPLAAAPQKNSSLICPTCFKIPIVPTPCPKCRWPMCGQDCSRSRHATECRILSKNLKKQTKAKKSRDWNSLQDSLIAIRCLNLKSSDNKKWKELLDMETNWDEWSRSSLYDNAKELVKVIRAEFGISEEVHDTEEIMKVLAILDINAYEIKMPDVNIQGAYKLASLAEHSCVPNALKSTMSGSLLLTLRAATDIPKGAHIATTYCDVLWPTCQRQRYIKWSKFFVCQCPRCTDPMELGSHISSLLCSNCPAGTALLPDLDSVPFNEGLWTDTSKDYLCGRCKSRFPAKECESILRTAESQLQELDKDCSIENVATFEEWLDQWTVSPAAKTTLNYHQLGDKVTPCGGNNDIKFLFLHPQHALCLDACHTVFLLYSTESSTLAELRRKESLGTHLLQATNALFPEIAMFRGTIMYELAITKAALFARLLDKDIKEDPSLRTLAQEILWLLPESLDILKFESEDQPEGQLFSLGFKQLEEFKPFLEKAIPNLNAEASGTQLSLSQLTRRSE